ncbi:MAG: hypothetical protein U1A27_02615 [Phycisphaerae bacterium]
MNDPANGSSAVGYQLGSSTTCTPGMVSEKSVLLTIGRPKPGGDRPCRA